MSNGKGGSKKIIGTILSIIIVLIASYFGIDISNILEQETSIPEESVSIPTLEGQEIEGELIVTMIDVGQADSFLFQQDGKTALVDCGTSSGGETVTKYLKELGIKKLDYVFGTHPHNDHTGGMENVISNFKVGKIILPKVDETKVTSNYYQRLVTKIADGGYKLEYAQKGKVYKLGDAEIKILEQLTDYRSSLNNYSAIMKVSFGEMDIIMTGDAETPVEESLLESAENIDAEILKVGHHGSDTSTSTEFLDAVSPDYALISTEIGNIHDHPTKVVMDRLKEREIEVYRTDESGTVIITITSNSATFNSEPDDYLSGLEVKARYE